MKYLPSFLFVLFLSSNSFAGYKIEVFSVNGKDRFQDIIMKIVDL